MSARNKVLIIMQIKDTLPVNHPYPVESQVHQIINRRLNKSSYLLIFIGFLSSINPGAVLSRILGGGVQLNSVIVVLLVAVFLIGLAKGRRFKASVDFYVLISFGFLFSFISFFQESLERSYSYESLQLYWKGFIFWFIFPTCLNVLRNFELTALSQGLFYGQIANFIVAILQTFFKGGTFSQLTNSQGSDFSAARAAGFWGDANEAAFIGCLVYVIVGIIKFNSKYPYWWSGISIGFVISTASRSGCAAMLLVLILNVVSQKKQTALKLIKSIGEMVAAPIMLVLYINYFGDIDIFNRFYFITEMEGGGLDEGSNSLSRLNLFTTALRLVLEENPLLGVGGVKMSRIIPMGQNGLGPHNLFVYIYGSAGIFAIFAFLCSFILFLYRIISNLNQRWWSTWFVMTIGFMTLHSIIFTQHFALLYAIIFNLALTPKLIDAKSRPARTLVDI